MGEKSSGIFRLVGGSNNGISTTRFRSLQPLGSNVDTPFSSSTSSFVPALESSSYQPRVNFHDAPSNNNADRFQEKETALLSPFRWETSTIQKSPEFNTALPTRDVRNLENIRNTEKDDNVINDDDDVFLLRPPTPARSINRSNGINHNISSSFSPFTNRSVTPVAKEQKNLSQPFEHLAASASSLLAPATLQPPQVDHSSRMTDADYSAAELITKLQLENTKLKDRVSSLNLVAKHYSTVALNSRYLEDKDTTIPTAPSPDVIDTLKAQLTDCREVIQRLGKEKVTLENSAAVATAEARRLRIKLATTERETTVLCAETQGLRRKIVDDKDNTEVKEQLKQYKGENAKIAAELNNLKESLTEHKATILALESHVKSIQTESEGKDVELRMRAQKEVESEHKAKEKEKEISELKKEILSLEAEAGRLESEAATARGQLEKIRKSRAEETHLKREKEQLEKQRMALIKEDLRLRTLANELDAEALSHKQTEAALARIANSNRKKGKDFLIELATETQFLDERSRTSTRVAMINASKESELQERLATNAKIINTLKEQLATAQMTMGSPQRNKSKPKSKASGGKMSEGEAQELIAALQQKRRTRRGAADTTEESPEFMSDPAAQSPAKRRRRAAGTAAGSSDADEKESRNRRARTGSGGGTQ